MEALDWLEDQGFECTSIFHAKLAAKCGGNRWYQMHELRMSLILWMTLSSMFAVL
jgi:hypothetical protein